MSTSAPGSPAHPEADAHTIAWRLTRLERTVEQLEAKVDRLTWALTIAALSFAGSAAVIIISITTGNT